MRGTSRASLRELKERLDAVLGADGGEESGFAAALGEELFAVTHLLDREHGLRRALSDPAKQADEKAAVVRSLLGDKVTPATVDLTAAAVALRWSSPRDRA